MARRSSTTRRAAEERGGGQASELEVPTSSLNELLDRLAVPKIDLLSMRLQEDESAGLAGFDIDRFKPELVCIKARREVLDAIFGYFHKHGYGRLDRYLRHDGSNWYFAPQKPHAH